MDPRSSRGVLPIIAASPFKAAASNAIGIAKPFLPNGQSARAERLPRSEPSASARTKTRSNEGDIAAAISLRSGEQPIPRPVGRPPVLGECTPARTDAHRRCFGAGRAAGPAAPPVPKESTHVHSAAEYNSAW
jgi:hypothetical protein